MGTSALRRLGLCLLGLLVSACGCLAGIALAGGAQPGGLTTILSTVGISTTVSTPAVTTTVSTPTLPVTTTVALPPVTTAAATTVTVSVPTTVAAPTVSTTVAVTVPPVTTPAVPSVPAATVAVPAPKLSASTPGTAAPAHVGVGVTVSAPAASAVQTSVGSAGGRGSPPAAAIGVSVGSGTASSPGTALASGEPAAVALAAPLSRPFAAPSRDQRSGRTHPEPGAAPIAATALISPLAREVAASTTPAGSDTSPTVQPPVAPSGSRWSGADTRRAALGGGLAALLVLATLIGAGAARSAALVAACSELARFPFPRFRVLPCPGFGRAASGSLEPLALSGSADPPVVGNAASVPGSSYPPPLAPGPRLPVIPRIGGIVGAAVTKEHAWSIVKAAVLAMLGAANALIASIRWRIQRLHAR